MRYWRATRTALIPMPSNPKENPGLLILGMHRSGTSCLAGMLGCAGFHVGDVDEWNPYNLKGNRENLAASAINEALLQASGGDWDEPPERIRVSAHHRDDIRRLTDELAAAGKPWLLKDPRTLLVLKAWTDTIPDIARLGIFRHPVPVAHSLQRRDETSLEEGVTLWCAYNERLLAAHGQRPFPLIAFNGEPAHLQTAVAASMNALMPARIADGTLEPGRAGDFFDSSLVHHVQPLEADLGDSLAALSVPPKLIHTAQNTWSRLLERQGPVRMEAESKPAPSAPSDRRSSKTVEHAETTRGNLESIDGQLETADDRIDLIRRGMATFEAQGDRAGLKRWLQGWAKRRPDDPFLHWELATLHREDGDLEPAIAHALEARRLAPSWISPTKALALWAFEAGQWKLAAETNRALYAVQFSRAKDRPWAAELFVDRGDGFNGEEALERSIDGATRSVSLRFEDPELLRGMNHFRLDPLNQPAVLTDLRVVLHRTGGDVREVKPTSSNAELASEGVFFFTTEDPQLHFALELTGEDAIVAIEAHYRLTHTGDDVPAEVIRRLKALLGEARERISETRNPSLLDRLLGQG